MRSRFQIHVAVLHLTLLLSTLSWAQAQAACGDGHCATGENSDNCVRDCDTHCGNGLCELGEACASCPEDCGACDLTCPPAECVGPDCLETCATTESFPKIAADVIVGEETVTEDTCAAVLFDECGNGICEEDELGTSCKDRCEVDCGPCEVKCGDGFCDAVNGENCKNCGGDCGPCLCPRPNGGVTVGVQSNIELLKWNLATPEVMQTGATLTLKASVKPKLVSEATSCAGKAPIKGELSLCQKYLGKRFCVGANLTGPASCTAQCEPGVSACSPLTSCCKASNMTGSVFGSLGYEVKSAIGIYNCSIGVDAGLTSGLSIGQIQAGLSDTCETKWSLQPKNGLAPSFQMFANGRARCGVTLFGLEHDVAGIAVANCASVTLDQSAFNVESGFSVPRIAKRGAAMDIAWPSVKIGYFFINSWKNKFTLGDGCAF